jgi:hypothetical protein
MTEETVHIPPISHVCKSGPTLAHPKQPRCTDKYHYGGLWFPSRVGPDPDHLKPTKETLVRDYLEKRGRGMVKFFNLQRKDGALKQFDDADDPYQFWEVEWLDINVRTEPPVEMAAP